MFPALQVARQEINQAFALFLQIFSCHTQAEQGREEGRWSAKKWHISSCWAGKESLAVNPSRRYKGLARHLWTVTHSGKKGVIREQKPHFCFTSFVLHSPTIQCTILMQSFQQSTGNDVSSFKYEICSIYMAKKKKGKWLQQKSTLYLRIHNQRRVSYKLYSADNPFVCIVASYRSIRRKR